MPLSPQTEALIEAFGRRPDVAPEQSRNLRTAIEASPRLAEQVDAVVMMGCLQRIALLHDSLSEGEYVYQLGELRVHPRVLATQPDGRFDPGAAISLLGHELQHGANTARREEAVSLFCKDVAAIAGSSSTEHDYTVAISNHLDALQWDEAIAEISAWNAMISAEHKKAEDQQGSMSDLKGIYEMHPRARPYIEVDFGQERVVCRSKPNLELTDDLYMVASVRNIEGVGQHYFDRGTMMGHHGNSNYPNLYAAPAISFVAQTELSRASSRASEPVATMRIDMEKLGLSPRIVAENGVDLGGRIESMVYLDGSTRPPCHAMLWHTLVSHDYPLAGPCLDQISHPGHGLYRDAVHAFHLGDLAIACHAGGYENLAAALAVSAWRNDMDGIDEVISSYDGRTAVAVQGRRSPRQKVAMVDIAQAVGTSVEQSSRQWQELQQERAVPDARRESPMASDAAPSRGAGRDGSDRLAPAMAMSRRTPS